MNENIDTGGLSAGSAGRPVVSRSSDRGRASIRELWAFRNLLRSLVVRDLKIKYQGSMIGIAWTLLNPLLTVAILVTVFSHVIRISVDHYWAFLLSGFFVWNFIQQNVFHATSVLQNHAALNRSVYFPREVLILGAMLTKFVEFLMEFAIVLILLAVFYYQTVPSSLILLPWIVLVLLMMTVGLMFPLAVMAVYFRDVQQAVPIAMMSLFYLSPIFYPVEMIPEAARPFYYLNPLVGLMRLFHVVVFQGAWPTMTLLASVSAVAFAVSLTGYLIFSRYKDVCVEIA
ncbi:MAG: ABC transporter permease [Nitrospirae bacterium]|nr:ABC transporter permease [Nitrospirota bacterium]